MSQNPAETPPPVLTPVSAPAPWALWSVRLLATIALGISGYLAWLAYSGDTAAGCGRSGSFGCEHVLSSRWSFWISIVTEASPPIDIPVSAAAFALWLTVLFASLFAGLRALPLVGEKAWLLVTALTVAAALAAGWFVGLQGIRLQHWCQYCLAAHLCAIAACAMTLGSSALNRNQKTIAIVFGIVLGALVPAGQLMFPFKADNVHVVADATVGPPTFVTGVVLDSAVATPERFVEVLGGATKIDVASLPHLGETDAPYVLVVMYDYACSHCRKLHHELLAVQQQYGERLTLVMLPTPLSHKCNPHIPPEGSTSPDSCELAQLAIIVWSYQPAEFAEFDAWLFEKPTPRTLAEARTQAAAIIGESAFAAAEKDERFTRQLQRHVELFDRSPADLLPQVLGKNAVLEAGVDSQGELLEVLHEDLGVPRP